ncbi:MAG: hypothetical protein ACJAZ9_000335 [Neolewinella sp.]
MGRNFGSSPTKIIPVKNRSSFAWLLAATLTATLTILTLTQAKGCGNYLLASTSSIAPAAAAPAPIAAETTANNRIQIAFLLDTSSSMDGLIDQAKARLWNILGEILKAEKNGEAPTIEVALYHYGNTTLLPQNGYIQQLSPLTTDVDAISEKLFALKTSGGDEYCGHVVLKATDELEWDADDNTVKLVYIAGNESFDQGEVPAIDALGKAAGKGIIVNTILCGNPNGADGNSWRAGARAGKGEFFYINQDEKVVYIPSPFDEAIEKCNLRLNKTYIPIGSRGAALQANQIAQDANAQSYGQANLSSRAKFKASSNYRNAGWDLLDANDEDPSRVLKEKMSLPDSLSQLSEVEFQQKLTSLKNARRSLQREIQTLTNQRDKFVEQTRRKQSGTASNTLGAKISQSLRNRLVQKGYRIKK